MILTVGGIKGGSGVAKIEIEGKAVSSIEEEAGVMDDSALEARREMLYRPFWWKRA